MAGNLERGIEQIEVSMRLDPMSWVRANQLNWLAIGRFGQERYPEALALLREAERLKSTYPTTLPMLTACYGQLGEVEAAGRAFEALQFSERKTAAWAQHLFRDPRCRQRFLDGMAAARESAMPIRAEAG